MTAIVSEKFIGYGSLTNFAFRVDPLNLPGFRDVRCPPPFRITVDFHPEAGFFPGVSKYESGDVA